MVERKIQAVINRLNDRIKQIESNAKAYRSERKPSEADFLTGMALGIGEAVGKLKMLKESVK